MVREWPVHCDKCDKVIGFAFVNPIFSVAIYCSECRPQVEAELLEREKHDREYRRLVIAANN